MINQLSDDPPQTTALRVSGFFDPPPVDGSLWIAECGTFDIPETIAACIRSAAPGMVAITLSRNGGAEMVRVADKAATARGARVIWTEAVTNV